jgi:hypothetical protein
MKKQQTNKPFLDSLLMQISDYQVLATVLSGEFGMPHMKQKA